MTDRRERRREDGSCIEVTIRKREGRGIREGDAVSEGVVEESGGDSA